MVYSAETGSIATEQMASSAPQWQPIVQHDGGKESVLLIAKYPANGAWSDIYYGWLQPEAVNDDWSVNYSRWARWPHPFPPSHFAAATTPDGLK